MAQWRGLQVRLQHVVSRARHRRHHPVGADGDDAVDSRNRRSRCRAERAAGVGAHRLARCCRRSCGPAARLGVKPGASSRAPDHDVGGALRCPRPCSGRSFSCSRRSRAPASRRRAAPGRSRTAPRCPGRRRPAPRSRSRNFGRRPGRPHQDHRFAGLQVARTGPPSRPSRARWSTAGPCPCRPRRRSARGLPSPSVVPATRVAKDSKFCRR